MFWLLKLAWKNLWRNKSRTAISMAAIFFAVVLSVLTSSLQQGVFGNLVKNVVSFYSGYIQIHKNGYWDERTLDNTFEDSSMLRQQILEDANIDGITPRLESFALASSSELTKGCMVVGIAPITENQITQIQHKIVQGEYLTDTDNEAIVAQGLAQRLGLKLNDTLVLLSQGYQGATAAGKYRIKGLLKFGSPELNEQSLFLALPTAQKLYGAEGRLTSYVLALKNISLLGTTAADVRQAIGKNYETMTWEEMMPQVIQHIRTDEGSMRIIQWVLNMLVCFGIFGTLLMMMVERRYEIGMLMAIGMKKSKLMKLLLMESLLSVSTGCILGICASIPIVYYLKKYPIRFKGELAKVYEEFGFEAIFPTSTDKSLFITQGLIVLTLGLILSCYPVVKIARMNAVTAMKR